MVACVGFALIPRYFVQLRDQALAGAFVHANFAALKRTVEKSYVIELFALLRLLYVDPVVSRQMHDHAFAITAAIAHKSRHAQLLFKVAHSRRNLICILTLFSPLLANIDDATSSRVADDCHGALIVPTEITAQQVSPLVIGW